MSNATPLSFDAALLVALLLFLLLEMPAPVEVFAADLSLTLVMVLEVSDLESSIALGRAGAIAKIWRSSGTDAHTSDMRSSWRSWCREYGRTVVKVKSLAV